MRPIAVVALPLLLVAVAGCQTTQYSGSPQAVPLARGGKMETTSNVMANAGEWRNSGVSVERGRRYRIRAQGSWSAAPTCSPTGPEGDGMYGLLCPPWPLGRVLTGYPHQRLIGKIGDSGAPFPIGTYHELTAPRDGTLFLNMNEQFAGVGDNGGSLTVTVSLDAASPSPAAAAPPPATRPAPARQAARPAARFARAALAISFKKGPTRPDDIAVIIGNADYGKLGKDISDVAPAYSDAESVKRYAVETLGVREGNIIDLRDATSAKLVEVFGSSGNARGQLHDWVRPGISRVFVYYAGHGAPAGSDGSAVLVPADSNSARIELSGYPLATLYANLGQIPAKSITVVLEACFSGAAQGGSVVSNASPVYLKAKAPDNPAHITIISAGSLNQMASWEQDKSNGLFTKYFLKAMSGEADAAPHGDGNGTVDFRELDRYLKGTLTYYARRYYGRDQTAQITVGR
jgi:hypothetical protein